VIILRVLVNGKTRLRTRVSASQLRPTLDLITLELVKFRPHKTIVVVADYGDIAAIVYRRNPTNDRPASRTA